MKDKGKSSRKKTIGSKGASGAKRIGSGGGTRRSSASDSADRSVPQTETAQVTERKQAEEALKESEQKYKLLIEATNTGYVIIDESGRVMDANQEYVRMTGRDRIEDILGRPVTDWTASYDLERNAAEVRKCMESGSVHNLVIDYVDTQGKTTPVEINATVLWGPSVVRIFSICRDITERKRSEDALKESEELYRLLTELSPDMIAIHREGRFVFINKAGLRMLGADRPEQLLGKLVLDVVHPDYRDIVRERVKRGIQEGVKASFIEEVFIRFDGTEVPVEVTGLPFAYKGGPAMIVIARDITERKRSEDALKVSEAKYRRLYNDTPILLHSIDRNGILVDVNDYWLKTMGYKRNEVIGRKTADFFTDASRKYAEDVVLPAFFRDGVVKDIPYQFMKKNGDVLDVLLSATAEWDAAGNIVRSLAVIEDVTERKRVEEKISTYSAGLQRLLSVSREMTATTDIARLYRTAVQTAADLLQFDFSTIMVLSDDRSRLTIMDAIGFPPSMIGHFNLVEGEGLSTHVIKIRQPDAVLDFLVESRFQVPPVVRELNIRSALCVPMMIEESVFGVLIGHTLTQRTFSDEAVALFQNIGDQAAVAIKNALNRQALAKSERMLQTIIDTEPDCIKVIDEESRLIMMNRAGLNMIQADALDQVTGQFVCPMVAPENQQAFMDLTRQVFQGGSGSLEFRMVGMRGSQLWLETHAVPLRNEKDEIIALLGVTRDITGRKRAEEALRENQAQLDLALQSAHMGVWRWEIKENRRYFDDLTCQLLGIEATKFTGTVEEFLGVVHPEDRDKVKAALARSLERDLLYEPAYRIIWPDGSIHYITSRGRLFRDEKGQPARINGVLWDITDQRRVEQELIETEKLESIGTLAGGIAHDFNNLLQGIFGFISMAKLTFDQKEKSLAMLAQAEKALHQSVNLTSQLLTFSKGGKPVKKVFALRPLIENSVAFALSGSRTTYEIVTDEKLRVVEADEGQIGQVTQNIVLNADQAMPLGGMIRVSIRNMSAAALVPPADLQGDLVEISIRDQGTGIPTEHLTRIFDPYFTTKEKGSGLGLATSYSIIKNHGGLVRVRSEIGKGTTFFIYLPASDSAVEGPKSPAIHAATRKGRILVMDDEELIRMVAGELLAAFGHEVAFAEKGETALEAYRAARDADRPFDIVILDLTIRGGMGGMETLQKLMEIDPDVKAIVSSGYSDDAVMSNYRKQGFRAFLKKPYNIEELQGTLNALFS